MSVYQEITVLKEIANDDYATVVTTCFKNKDKVKAGDDLIELETSKTTFLVSAPKEGYVEYLCKEKDEVAVGSVIIRIYDDPVEILEGNTTPLKGKEMETRFSVSANELIRTEKLDPRVFAGKDFVSADDVREYIKSHQNRQGSS